MGDAVFRGDSIEPRLDGLRVHRCQVVTDSVTLNDEKLNELGNKNTVETVYDAPSVSCSLESYEYGEQRTLALATNQSFGCKVALTGAGFNINAGIWQDSDGVWELETKLTGLAISATSSDTRIDVVSLKKQFTAPQYTLTAGVESGTPSAPSTPSNEIKIAEITVGTAGATSVTDSRATTFTAITERSFDGAKVDYTSIIQDPGTYSADTGTADVVAAEYLMNLYPTSWSGTYEVSGVARETIEFVNDRYYLLHGAAKHVVRDQFVSSGAATFTLSETPALLSCNSKRGLKVTNGGTICTESAAPATSTEYSISSTTLTFGAAPTSGNIVTATYGTTISAGQSFKTINTVSKGGLKRGQITLSLYNGATDTELTRVQSVNFSVPIERSENYQLGDHYAFNRSMQFPVKGSGSLSVLHSDVDLFFSLLGLDPDTKNSLDLEDYQRNINTSTVTLKVKLYDDTDHTNLYRTIAITQIMISSKSPISKGISADATTSIDFTFDAITSTNNYF